MANPFVCKISQCKRFRSPESSPKLPFRNTADWRKKHSKQVKIADSDEIANLEPGRFLLGIKTILDAQLKQFLWDSDNDGVALL
jgi:hypothetical protein